MRWSFLGGPFAAGLLIVVAAGEVHAQTRSEAQFWTAAVVTAKITGETPKEPGFSGWLDLHARRGPERSVVIVRPGVGYRFSEALSAWLGYAWVPTLPDEGSAVHEHRVWEQLIFQGTEGILRFQVRPRLEQRLRAEQPEVGLRGRLFLRANLRFYEKLPLDLAIWDESFWGFNETAWGQPSGFDQNRAFIGPAWSVGPGRFEAGYLNVPVRGRDGSWLIQHNLSLWVFVAF